MNQYFLTVLAVTIISFIVNWQESESIPIALIVEGVLAAVGLISGLMSIYSFVDTYSSATEESKEKTDYSLQLISFQNDIDDIKKKLANIPEQIIMYQKMDTLLTLVQDIEYIFADYVIYSRNFNKLSSQNYFQNETYKIYIDRLFVGNALGIERTLEKIIEAVAPKSRFLGLSLLDVEILRKKNIEAVCKSQLSITQSFVLLLGQLTTIEAKGLLSLLFGYELYEWLNVGNFTNEKILAKQKSIERNNQVIAQFKIAMQNTSSLFYVCDPKEHKKGVTYGNLIDPFLSQNITIEPVSDNCADAVCSSIEYKNVKPCVSDRNWTKKPCLFHSCAEVEVNQMYKKTNSLCTLSRNGKVSTFDIKHKINNYYMSVPEIVKFAEEGLLPYAPCNTCTCRCPYKSTYSINMEASFVHFTENYVVTGVRFVLKDNVISLQLQQGALLPYGWINNRTLKWLPLSKVPTNVMQISHSFNSFDLDAVVIPDDNVVVGLQFVYNDAKSYDVHIGLKVYYLPINFVRGYFEGSGNVKYVETKYVHRREAVWVGTIGITGLSSSNIVDSKDDDYIYLYSNSYNNDTFPYLDLQNIVPAVPTPLSGVGLIHKGNRDSAGLLSFSLVTYNLKPYIRTKPLNEADVINI